MTGREEIEEAVRTRATHGDSEDVGRTVSLANGELIFGHDHHGRFLIELLQNAADAWAARGDDGDRSRVEIAIAEGPVLLVANEGESFPASVVIKSLGFIGRSTKTEGKAIGHKGIGFKSVLEISATPEIYSGLGSEEPELAVRFDPREGLRRIHDSSPDWAELAAEDIRAVDGNELALVPVLQFPIWVDSIPGDVQELADSGFETVIRVPFGEDPGPDPPLDEAQWLATVRGAIAGISDEILLLLGAFEEVVIEDRLQGTRSVIHPAWEETTELSDGTIHEHVVVTRDDVATRWLLFRRALPTLKDLASEIVVGARIGEAPGSPLVAPAEDEPSAPFYLFFPTTIRSGLPLLLHGYFKVSAARTNFYEAATSRNTAILQELATLVRDAIAYFASRGDVDLANFAALLDEAGGPDADLARRFREHALTLLDDVAWVPLEADSSESALGKPTKVLVDEDADIVEKLRQAFPAAYVRESVGLAVPSHRIGPAGNRFLVSRRPPDASSLWTTVERLYRPGGRGPWPEGAELNGFRALLDLTRALQGKYGDEADEVLARLRGAEDSVLVPVTAPAGGVDMLPLPEPSEGVAGRASRGIMARTGAPGEHGLVPPASLGLAFVPDGVLSSEGEIANAAALGIRPFTVTNVLDRVGAATERETEDGEQARFLFRLLSRRAAPELSVGDAWRQAREFKPAYFFWCRTSPTVSGTEREQQRRRQSLAGVRLPGRDGTWRPAGALAFGRDWADWIERALPASLARDQRCEAYTALDDLSPGDATMLASPERLREVLGEVEIPFDPENEEAIDADQWLHAFLLRLGIWETLPVEGFDDAGQANRDAFPWSDDPLASKRDESIAGDGWRFGLEDWGGHKHKNTWVAQDFRFRWNLADAAQVDAVKLTRILGMGTPLYEDLRHLTVFCQSCSSDGGKHTARRWSRASDGYPSLLAFELRAADWVPAVRDGELLDAPLAAASVWWAQSIPSGAALAHSSLRFLPLCDPAAVVSSRLRELVGIESMADASRDSILGLLRSVREQFEADVLAPDPGASSSARTALGSLHRQAYERLANLGASVEEDGDGATDGGELLVLCEVGDALAYRKPAHAFHDNGSFASYRRYFGAIPFADIPKEKGSVASYLGIEPFEVELDRRESGEPEDVTDEVSEFLADRVPEFLAILVYHVLAGQTLDPGKPEFATRARRLARLRVKRVDDLVIEARVKGSDAAVTIGEQSEDELFLEDPTTPNPVIYLDLNGDRWRESFRRRLGPLIARVLERPDYADIFTLFLLGDTDLDREATLLDRGIRAADVDKIRAAIGIVSEDEKRLHTRWFGAVIALLRGAETSADVAEEAVAAELTAAGLSQVQATRLIELGGGEQARRTAAPGGALSELRSLGLDLRSLDDMLKAAGDEGLRIGVARAELRDWLARHRRAAATVLSTRSNSPESAKGVADGWSLFSTPRRESGWLRSSPRSRRQGSIRGSRRSQPIPRTNSCALPASTVRSSSGRPSPSTTTTSGAAYCAPLPRRGGPS